LDIKNTRTYIRYIFKHASYVIIKLGCQTRQR
jgi:hypothetical protein